MIIYHNSIRNVAIVLFVIAVVLYVCSIRIFGHFWAIQPVTHRYDFMRRLFPQGIIQAEYPITRYCNFEQIETTSAFFTYKEGESDSSALVQFIRDNYSKDDYFPEETNITSYFKCHNNPHFVSIYKKDDYIIGCITTRPVNVTYYKSNTHLVAYYCDWLTVHKMWRKKGVAQQLIQTHEYMQRKTIDNRHKVSLFKREGNPLSSVVPFISYDAKMYNLTYCIIPTFALTTKITRVDKKNFRDFAEFLLTNAQKRFGLGIIVDYPAILELISSNNYHAYMVCRIDSNEILSCFIFRESKASMNNVDIIILIASICCDDNGNDYFNAILHNYSGYYVVIEEISDNVILKPPNGARLVTTIPMSYYWYNFAYYTPSRVIIIV